MGFVPAKTLWILGGAAVAGVALGSLVGGGDTTPAIKGSGYPPLTPGGGQWVDPGAPARIGQYADQVAAVTGWGSTLRRYLVAVAYWESRGNSRACKEPCEDGFSRGWFQLRETAKCFQWSGLTPDQFLNNEAMQVAVAACHAYRLGTICSNQGQQVQTQDVRRGWWKPHLVAQQYRTDPAIEFKRQNYREALTAVGEPLSFMTAPMFPVGFHWPGFDALMGAVNA